jgi:hypothetical protein
MGGAQQRCCCNKKLQITSPAGGIAMNIRWPCGYTIRQIRNAIGRPLHHEPAIVEQQGAQSGEFLASSRSSWPAMQTARHDVAVAPMGPNG